MKFSIRDLLLVTVIVALAIGWWVDRLKLADARQEFEHDARSMSRYFDTNRSPYSDDAERMNEFFRKYHPAPTQNSP